MKLREVVDSDHKFLLHLHNDPEVLRNLTHPTPITRQQHLNWWETIKNNPNEIRLIFEVGDETNCYNRVGFTKFYYIDHVNSNCVLGADIHKDFRGKGLAKFMWTLMLNKCFDELKLHRASLSTASYNTIGQRVYTNLGFKEEGRSIDAIYRDGSYHDSVCMYLLRDTWVQT